MNAVFIDFEYRRCPRHEWNDVSYVYERSVSLHAMDMPFHSAKPHQALEDAKAFVWDGWDAGLENQM